MDNTLVIQITEDADPKQVMANFPFDGSRDYSVQDDESDDTQWISVPLGAKPDTSVAQEQHLNADNRVIYYAIR